jgi:hypothetical protein
MFGVLPGSGEDTRRNVHGQILGPLMLLPFGPSPSGLVSCVYGEDVRTGCAEDLRDEKTCEKQFADERDPREDDDDVGLCATRVFRRM